MIDDILHVVNSRVSHTFCTGLNLPFSRAEVEAALQNIGPTKASGPDDMPALFL